MFFLIYHISKMSGEELQSILAKMVIDIKEKTNEQMNQEQKLVQYCSWPEWFDDLQTSFTSPSFKRNITVLHRTGLGFLFSQHQIPAVIPCSWGLSFQQSNGKVKKLNISLEYFHLCHTSQKLKSKKWGRKKGMRKEGEKEGCQK